MSASVFAKDGRLSTKQTIRSSYNYTHLSHPTQAFKMAFKVGCTLLPHPTSQLLLTPRAYLWGVHWRCTGWRLVGCIMRFVVVAHAHSLYGGAWVEVVSW